MVEFSDELKSKMMAVIEGHAALEVNAFSESLSEEFGIPQSHVMLKALSLYKLAGEAEARGDRIAVLSPDDEIVTELTGVREALHFDELIGS